MINRILVISKCPTHPTSSGNSSWILSFIKALIKFDKQVHFLYIYDKPFKASTTNRNNSLEMYSFFGRENFYIYKMSNKERLQERFRSYIFYKFNNGYFRADSEYPKGLADFVNKLNAKYSYDACIINYFYLSKLFTKIRIKTKAIITHDCFAYKQLKLASPAKSLTPNEEAKAMQRCPHIFALQDQEADYFRIIAPRSNIYTIYNTVNYHHKAITSNHNILFLAGDNQYNQNGINWFIINVFPILQQEFKDSKLIIGGKICEKLASIKDESIILKGFVNNIEGFYSLGDIAINPIYEGTGLKIKTIEALAEDMVTITRSHSLLGIYKANSAPIIISDKPQEWLCKIRELWSDNNKQIAEIKQKNNIYISEMNNFINSEFHRFFNSVE